MITPTDMTIAEHIDAASAACKHYMDTGAEGNREFALAKTALEDARIRATRGIAERLGVRSDVDLERMDARAERARFSDEVREATS